ncbi:MBL fold metallo-hydrolase [Cognatishimia activa]|uniref:MBL fold metallo-hydrolase n=1 Tax=Cognatishimia activa TaxID=1715691 RepID=A0A975I773_9RHOB|nr:MBL fold metallo-hydrolase [Cognatishimia activa]QTN35664.1 MBL fold metallo-hydrolase [Cognatishimia activa]
MTDAKAPEVGIAQELDPGLRRILAPNPSPMTYWGTNTYLLGHSEITVIDPGPADPRHLDAILASLEAGQKVAKIVVTHAHLDHSPLASMLSDRTGAPIYAFGDHLEGRSEIMQKLSAQGFLGGGEGVDAAFKPDVLVANGDQIGIEDGQLEVLHTPGHFGNHISIAWDDICFTGDHVMGWASSLVSPPDGDLTDFMASCDLLAARQWRRFHAGHGAPIEDPNGRLTWLITHRKGREKEILETLSKAPDTAEGLARKIYTDVNPALLPAAARNVFAHLVDLTGRGLAKPTQDIEFTSPFEII